MNRHTTHILLLLLVFLSLATSVDARKKKKVAEPEVAALVPDKAASRYKAMPDSHPKLPPKPYIMGGGGGSHMHGIDVSHYQPNINWKETAKDVKVGFVYIKATEGKDHVDDTYEYNIREARRNGVRAGSYHFFRANVTGADQFRNFTRIVSKSQQDLIPMVDVESLNGMTIATMHTRLLELLQLITHEYGVRPLIYTGRNFYNKYFGAYSQFKPYKFMIAQYTKEEPILMNNDDYVIWQYTGHGSVKGIRGTVDQSRFHGRHSINEILYGK